MAEKQSVSVDAKKGFSADEYNQVAMGAKLRLVSLVKSNFHVNPDCLSSQDDWKLSYDHGEIACSYDSARGVVSAIFQYEVIAKHGRKTAMRAVAEYVVLYSVPNSSGSDAAEGFCHNVGRFAAYPYFRALVAQLTSGANLMLPPLPTIASTAHIPRRPSNEKKGNKHD